MIKELIIEGDFTVKGFPENVAKHLTYLKIKSDVYPTPFIRVESFSSFKGEPVNSFKGKLRK